MEYLVKITPLKSIMQRGRARERETDEGKGVMEEVDEREKMCCLL